MESENRFQLNLDRIIAIIAIVVSILCVFLAHFLTKTSEQSAIVESLSTHFDFVDKEMSYEQAMQSLYEESQKKDREILSLNQQNSNLLSQLTDIKEHADGAPIIEYKNSSFIKDGLKVEDNVNRSVALIENHIYYSDYIINKALENKLSYNPETNIISFSSDGRNLQPGTKTDLFDTKVLYGGDHCETFIPSDGRTFSMGSNTYNKGFILRNPYSSYFENEVIALFDLQGRYSKITFDSGRLNESNVENATLKIYLDGVYTGEFALDGSQPPQLVSIDLNYAKSLKLELVSGYVVYGFANIVLES